MKLLKHYEVYIHVLRGPSNQSECREFEYVVFSQIDWLVFTITSYFVEATVASTTDEVKLSTFVEAGNLKTAWYMAVTLWVYRVSAAVIQESNEFVTFGAFQVRAVSIAIPVAYPCGQSLQVASTLLAQGTPRFWWIWRKDRLRSRFVLDPSHFLGQRGRILAESVRDVS
jgi:hypothetical protein